MASSPRIATAARQVAARGLRHHVEQGVDLGPQFVGGGQFLGLAVFDGLGHAVEFERHLAQFVVRDTSARAPCMPPPSLRAASVRLASGRETARTSSADQDRQQHAHHRADAQHQVHRVPQRRRWSCAAQGQQAVFFGLDLAQDLAHGGDAGGAANSRRRPRLAAGPALPSAAAQRDQRVVPTRQPGGEQGSTFCMRSCWLGLSAVSDRACRSLSTQVRFRRRYAGRDHGLVAGQAGSRVRACSCSTEVDTCPSPAAPPAYAVPAVRFGQTCLKLP
jgi:hypothetical protein